MNLKLAFTIALSKFIIKACRLVHWGGTSLPGKIANKLYPGIAGVLAVNFRTIMVTGTNGKTTTTRIISQMLNENGIDHITNKSGANLVSGIITLLIEAVDLKGQCSVSCALIEVDEAAFNVISRYIQPDVLVVTNFFRDQLDRFGELYTTLNNVKSGIQRMEKTTLVLNADDSLCASLGQGIQNKILYYGFDSHAHESSNESLNSDAVFCLFCKTKYEYDYHIYGHLGGFRCPNCGYRKPDIDIACKTVEELTSSYSRIRFSIPPNPSVLETDSPDKYSAKINLPGLYNIFNALSAIACGQAMGLPVEKTVQALAVFECGFGRMETIETDGKTLKVILVKNPTGFNQVLSYLLTEEKNMQVAFAINDNLADGTDISWLWDVDFEKLENIQDRLDSLYTSGLRGEDMSVRLKYAGIFTDKIQLIKDYAQLIDTALSKTKEGSSLYILPTYTAMLDIRKILRKKFGLREFWK